MKSLDKKLRQRQATRWLERIMHPGCMEYSIESLTRLLCSVAREANKKSESYVRSYAYNYARGCKETEALCQCMADGLRYIHNPKRKKA